MHSKRPSFAGPARFLVLSNAVHLSPGASTTCSSAGCSTSLLFSSPLSVALSTPQGLSRPRTPTTSAFSIAFDLHVGVGSSSRTPSTLFPLQGTTTRFVNNESVYNVLTCVGLPHLKDLHITPKLKSFASGYMLKVIKATMLE